jgi:hypothetical protein
MSNAWDKTECTIIPYGVWFGATEWHPLSHAALEQEHSA